jgi:hypothetical protein
MRKDRKVHGAELELPKRKTQICLPQGGKHIFSMMKVSDNMLSLFSYQYIIYFLNRTFIFFNLKSKPNIKY